MEKITSVDELRNAIQTLEFENELDGQSLKEQVYYTIESLKPANLIRSTMYEITSSPHLVENILGIAAGLVSGFISRRLAIGRSGNIIRNLLGTILQFGVTKAVARRFLKK
jgi:hypothetical protein